jgi:DNA-binding NtrC family response regulator
LPRASVLLADDEPVFGETTAELLRRHDYDCDLVPDVALARACLERRRYDVLVADIMMPGNTSLGLLPAARERQPDLSIILVTGYPSVETAVHSVDSGVFAYKIKPFAVEDFLATVAQAVRRSRLRRGLQDEAARSAELSARLQALADLVAREKEGRALELSAREYLRLVMGSLSGSLLEALQVVDAMDMPGAEAPLRTLGRWTVVKQGQAGQVFFHLLEPTAHEP